MRGKRIKKYKKRSTKKVALFLLLLICIIVMIYFGLKIINWIRENINNKNIIKEISSSISIDDSIDNIDKYKIDFTYLKQKNSDTVAWIKVNGTDIEFPVVKITNNDYYMVHSFDKSYNTAGWVFMDYRNKCDGLDKNIIIYSHNRRDGSMFGTLKNILTKEWQQNEENLTIPLITEKEKLEYQVFSVYRIEAEDYYLTTNFKSNSEFQRFIDTIKSRSVMDFNIDVQASDQILTLSTCADNNQFRVVLHAKKMLDDGSLN